MLIQIIVFVDSVKPFTTLQKGVQNSKDRSAKTDLQFAKNLWSLFPLFSVFGVVSWSPPLANKLKFQQSSLCPPAPD